MSKQKRRKSLLIFGALAVILFVASRLVPGGESGDIQEIMRDAVLHETEKVSLFGLEVNPGLLSAYVVTLIILIFALVVRFVFLPRFTDVPGRFQLLIEELVGVFSGLARGNSPHRNRFLGAYIFTAGVYIFVGTCFELLGVQAVTTAGGSISLPAPLADINGAICMGCLSYGVILAGGLLGNGIRGVGHALKDFSLPISMSFRLFGALLSGALVTELVYYFSNLSVVLPVVVGVLFTLLHALIQAYVLTMLTSLFYGESAGPMPKKEKKKKRHSDAADDTNIGQLTESEVTA